MFRSLEQQESRKEAWNSKTLPETKEDGVNNATKISPDHVEMVSRAYSKSCMQDVPFSMRLPVIIEYNGYLGVGWGGGGKARKTRVKKLSRGINILIPDTGCTQQGPTTQHQIKS